MKVPGIWKARKVVHTEGVAQGKNTDGHRWRGPGTKPQGTKLSCGANEEEPTKETEKDGDRRKVSKRHPIGQKKMF